MGSLNTAQPQKAELENGDTKSHIMTSLQPKVDVVVDLQYGSTGKGLFCGYLGDTRDYDTVISANMPNAGHTYIDAKGNHYMFKVLPSSAVGKSVKTVMIGPGAVFSVRRLAEEMMHLRSDQTLRIHPNATILTEDHAVQERKRLNHISSTLQGSAAAMIDKIWRSGDPVLAKHILKGTKFEQYVCGHEEWRIRLSYAEAVLAEGSQGYSLGINTHFYPYTTSRDCTPASFLSAMGIPLGMLNNVYGTCRTLPIRVGGPSGDCYTDQEELSWEELGLPEERTTVTNKIRRIFEYSKLQLDEAMWACNPDAVFVNFCNYVEEDYLANIMAHIDMTSNVQWLGFGPTFNDVGTV
jgi:adenylosuccinate synthase